MIIDYETPQPPKPREPFNQDFWDVVVAMALFMMGYIMLWNI
jgi:hypothetical protein